MGITQVSVRGGVMWLVLRTMYTQSGKEQQKLVRRMEDFDAALDFAEQLNDAREYAHGDPSSLKYRFYGVKRED